MAWKSTAGADIGAALRRFRTEHSLTLDDVATTARRYGADWTSATVVSLEKGGSKADSLPVILLLLATMNVLHDRYLAELVQSGDATEEEAQRQAHTYGLADLVDDDSIDVTDWYSISVAAAQQTLFPPSEKGPAVGSLTKMIDGWADAKGRVPTAAERRAASKLGTSGVIVGQFCQKLYGRSLDEEAADRAGGRDASPQKRGLATRRILAEIRQAMVDESRQHATGAHIKHATGAHIKHGLGHVRKTVTPARDGAHIETIP